MLLQTNSLSKKCYDLVIEKYKTEGIIKKYDNVVDFEDFEWIQLFIFKAICIVHIKYYKIIRYCKGILL